MCPVRFRWIASIGGTVLISALACTSGGEPLGGPHGGATSALPPPTEGATPGSTSPASSSGDASSSPDEGGASSSGSSVASGCGGGEDGGGGEGGAAPTWTEIYTNYLSASSPAACAACHTHATQMPTASASYTYLASQGYIGGACPTLVQVGSSCLTWYSGEMPPGGTDNPASDAQAVIDMNAWAAAGAKND
jgi:hypothetical protein